MEDNFDQTNFEEFLQKQVRNHRMYPADSVWGDINKKLHGDKKWPALTIAAFVLLGITILIGVYFPPKPDIFIIKNPPTETFNATHLSDQRDNTINNLNTAESIYKEKNKEPHTFANGLSKNSSDSASELIASNNRNIFSFPDENSISEVNETPSATQHINTEINKQNNSATVLNSPGKIDSKSNSIIPPGKVKSSTKKKAAAENLQPVKDYNDKNMVDGFLKEQKSDVSLYTTSKSQSLKNKFSYQIYVAPSVTYRNLVEDRSILQNSNNSGPVGLNYVADVNSVVRHKPGYGFEVGISIMYNLSEKFRIKSGFQFNVRQYTIEAYRSGRELASIALIEHNRIDTVNTIAIYRNSNGYSSAELINRYYQLSIPLGVEWEVIGNKKVKLNVAASIQPTYLLNHNAYLLSTNFKNYSQNPEMVRSWNINSNIEAFLSFKVGDFKWQVGPQIRYQPYSTFIRQYPIKEHLMDYGIKIGISKTIN